VRTAWCVGTSLALSCAIASVAWAGPSEEAAAEALFLEAKKLMAEGKYGLACAKLAESQRVDPAAGTLLNLANCYEKNGQLASAWVAFRSAASAARKDHAGEKERVAKERAAALETRLSKLQILVEDGARSPSLTVRRDGSDVSEAGLGTEIPVDPGEHTVEASAPGKRPWKKTVQVDGPGVVTISVPALQNAQETAAPAPQPPGPQASAAPQADMAPKEQASSSSQKTFGYVAVAVGVAGLVVGTVSGLSANAKKSDAEAQCRTGDTWQCSQQGLDRLNEGRTLGAVSTIGFIVGGLGVATGVTLLITAPSTSPRSGWLPTGVRLRGSF
jgi:hypothetical protein